MEIVFGIRWSGNNFHDIYGVRVLRYNDLNWRECLFKCIPCGIIIGNSRILYKKTLIPFFDGVTNLSQIMIFFLLGLLMFPKQMFHIVFLVTLFSVGIQGTLLPYVSKKLEMVDENSDVRKTYNDYQEESAFTLMRMYIPKGHNRTEKYNL